jgi:hypothetical protein
MKAPRETKVTIHGCEATFDADDDWRALGTLSESDILDTLAGTLHWQIQLPWMTESESIRQKFWKAYSTPKAEEARNVAIFGTVWNNHDDELLLLQRATSFRRSIAAGAYAEKPSKSLLESAGAIGLRFAELAAAGDPAPFLRMAKILKEGGMPAAAKPRGGIRSEDGRMFAAFCRLYVKARKLPSKRDLRRACGLADRVNEKLATKRMTKLGLSGLPTLPET